MADPARTAEALSALTDPWEQIEQANPYIARATASANKGRAIRDQALRTLRTNGATLTELATRSGLTKSSIRVITRDATRIIEAP